jgi:glycosyltransferase involved in cell wall biosynthesis
MKIGLIGCRGIPNHYGGFEQFAQKLSVGLVQKGHEVYVYNSSLHPYQEKKFDKVNIIHCSDPEKLMGTAGQFFYDRNCLADARKRKYDVLLHLGYTSDSLWWRLWKKMKDTKHLVNMDGLEWKRSKYNWLTRRFLKKAEALAAKHADLLIADSTAIAEHIKTAYDKKAYYIPYGAALFENPDPAALNAYNVIPFRYTLAVARIEPENNIETIIKAVLSSERKEPLLILGNSGNSFGKKLVKKYQDPRIRFIGVVYDAGSLNNLRYHSRIYFHGHSVGGTNPSLLEAMACQCNIAAHDNEFNKAVLENGGRYFHNASSLCQIIDEEEDKNELQAKKDRNLSKIKTHYSWSSVIDSYEKLLYVPAIP